MAILQKNTPSGEVVLYDDTLIADPDASLFDAEYWRSQQRVIGQAKGRGTTLFIDTGKYRWVLRHYCRGGLVGRVLRDEYAFTGLKRTRAFSEFRLLASLRGLSLPVPRPVAARVTHHGLWYRADIIIDMIPDSRDCHALLCESSLGPSQWHTIGATIARFHQHQVYHHDLNIRNILLDANDTVWLIDFDRCSQRNGETWKQGNLDRLLRSLRKEKNREAQFHWTEQDWQHLLEGYRRAYIGETEKN
ncbi:3-deoxy-D-manno-octulosonic acid kinase [Alteromonas sp. CYL-A6]|uniref:3-deoxy-D-manno-octulosonic acid kinase n=1 Tax=Alteromonas nitratireducens TaxID=3390813 RepID=UPI0034C25E00